VQELFGRIHEIKRKAGESETMVQEICSDIKSLDYAKKYSFPLPSIAGLVGCLY
jgi:hypothetical protein